MIWRILELAVAALLVTGGVRSLLRWTRREFASSGGGADHALYAAFVTGRVGLWFAFAGFLVLSASVEFRGRAYVDTMRGYLWYIMVPIVLGVVQLLAAFALGRRSSED